MAHLNKLLFRKGKTNKQLHFMIHYQCFHLFPITVKTSGCKWYCLSNAIQFPENFKDNTAQIKKLLQA